MTSGSRWLRFDPGCGAGQASGARAATLADMTSPGLSRSSTDSVDTADLGHLADPPRPQVAGLAFAAAKWREFPAAAQSRPLVLTSQPIGVGTFTTDEARVAVQDGLLSVDGSVPTAAVEAIRKAGLVRAERSDPQFQVMSAVPSSMGFSTDRGGRQLPAWLLSIRGIDGTCYVMDVESQALAYPSTESVTSVHPLGGYAKLLGDGLMVRIDFDPPWLTRHAGAASTAVDVLETATSVVFAPLIDTAGGHADVSAGNTSATALTFRLLEPLGARVLSDAGGSPLVVARRKRNGR